MDGIGNTALSWWRLTSWKISPALTGPAVADESRTWPISMEPTGISGGPPASALVSEKLVPEVPAMAVTSPAPSQTILLIMWVSVDARVTAMFALADTDSSAPPIKASKAAVDTASLPVAGVQAPPLITPSGRTTGAKPAAWDHSSSPDSKI